MNSRRKGVAVDSNGQPCVQTKYMRYEDGALYYHMGKTMFQEMAREAQATIRRGRVVWVNMEIFEKYFLTFSE